MTQEIRPAAARQLVMTLDARALQGLSVAERDRVVCLLAQVLLEASGLGGEEDGDEDL